MLYHISVVMAMGLGYCAAAIGASARIDLVVDYGRLAAEADDRKELALSH